jgi:hypothetical protein
MSNPELTKKVPTTQPSKGGLHCLYACEENNKTPFSNLPKNMD